ncbi:hypothetical protein [Azospirillum sp. B510]|uniref:hypothetical protein n=1 Tax=Azospirillum sp. (strain B510) TaxID=137722 RepID=UPI0011D0944A|nr:hypothetical protein [Azospirillum sp. B510]
MTGPMIILLTASIASSMTDDSRTGHAGPLPLRRSTEGRVRWALVADRSPLLREGLRLYLETLGWRVVAGRGYRPSTGWPAWCRRPCPAVHCRSQP